MLSHRSIVTPDELQELQQLTGLSIFELASPNLPANNKRGNREGFLASDLKFLWFDLVVTRLGTDFRKQAPDINWDAAADHFFRKLARARRRVNKRKLDAKQ